jgi:hypothetical protein
MILRNGKFSGKILRKIFHLTSLVESSLLLMARGISLGFRISGAAWCRFGASAGLFLRSYHSLTDTLSAGFITNPLTQAAAVHCNGIGFTQVVLSPCGSVDELSRSEGTSETFLQKVTIYYQQNVPDQVF